MKGERRQVGSPSKEAANRRRLETGKQPKLVSLFVSDRSADGLAGVWDEGESEDDGGDGGGGREGEGQDSG